MTKKRKGDGDDGVPRVHPSKATDRSSSRKGAVKTSYVSEDTVGELVTIQEQLQEGMELSKKQPSYKAVVQMLMTPLQEEERLVMTRQGDSTTKMYLVYQCPNQFCKECNCEIWFQKSVGFVNPFNHLRSCIANGNTAHLYMVYEQNKESK